MLRTGGWLAVCASLVWLSCERNTTSTRDSTAAATSGAPLSTAASQSPEPSTALPGAESNAGAEGSRVPTELVGEWTGHGTARVVKLELPGNQGVQLAWVQDKGTSHVGPVTLAVELTKDGVVQGTLSGSLGELTVTGNWDGLNPMHADLVPKVKAPEAFGGLLTVVLAEGSKSAEASLRVVSHDGKWVREATVPLGRAR